MDYSRLMTLPSTLLQTGSIISLFPSLKTPTSTTIVRLISSFLWLPAIDARLPSLGTLILLTFDETETYSVNNNIFTIALGGAVPAALVGTKDSTCELCTSQLFFLSDPNTCHFFSKITLTTLRYQLSRTTGDLEA